LSALLLDVNVVVAAHRDDHQHYAIAGSWFEDVAAGTAPFAVPLVVWASFLRLVTNRRIFDPPTPLADAFAFLDGTCAQPHHLSLQPGPRHLEILRRVCLEANATADLIPDAVIAAIALEHGAVVVSLDRDFARFPSIEFIVPGAERR
jgi:toxin-antitoxin system PIN domain toxin